MAPLVKPVLTSDRLPVRADVVIIGGGIVGLCTALEIAEQGQSVVVLEKGRLAGEQSSRNLGWVRKTNRPPPDLPLAVMADDLWHGMAARVGQDVGYRRRGILFLASHAAELRRQEAWCASVAELSPDSRMLTPAELDALVPGGRRSWLGGVYTHSDGSAEPTLASSAVAAAILRLGGTILEQTTAMDVETTAGQVSAVVTERGSIACDRVLLAGGLGSRGFLRRLGLDFPALPVFASVLRTAPIEGLPETMVAGPDFSFRRCLDGGYVITQRAAMSVRLTMDHLRQTPRYLGQIRANWHAIRLRGAGRSTMPRTLDPDPDARLIAEALDNCTAAWPAFASARIVETWAGVVDVTPNSMPVIAPVPGRSGLFVAAGFSGHGFGTAPAAGRMARQMVMVEPTELDLSPYAFPRTT